MPFTLNENSEKCLRQILLLDIILFVVDFYFIKLNQKVNNKKLF